MPSWKEIPLKQVSAGTGADMTGAPGDTINAVVLLDDWVPTFNPIRFDGEQPAVFSVQINIPAAITPEGCIFECGGNIRGAMLCFDGNGDLIWRFHNGAFGRRSVVANALIPRDETVTIVAEIFHLGGNTISHNKKDYPDFPDIHRQRVWVNHNLRGYGETARTEGVWAQFVSGAIDGTGLAHVGDRLPVKETGNFDQSVSTSGVIWVSDLRYYRNAIVEQPATNIETINVTQENEQTARGAQDYPGLNRVPWDHFDRVRIDENTFASTEQVVFDHNRIADVVFEDEDESQVVFDQNQESAVDWSRQVDSVVTQIHSKSCAVAWLNSKETAVF